MKIPLLEHQIEFLFDDNTNFLSIVGGYRCGKTVAACHKAIRLASLNQEPGAILEPTYGMITRTLIPTFNQILSQVKIKYSLNKSDYFYTLHFPFGDRQIWLLSAENYDKAAGMTLSYAIFDEFDRMKFSIGKLAMEMMTSRVTKGNKPQVCALSTPEGFNLLHYYYMGEGSYDTEGNKISGRKLIRASTRNNPTIPESWYDNMAATHSPQQLEAYIEGRFVNFTSGTVYLNFDRELNTTNATVNDFPKDAAIHIGIDFNYNSMSAIVNMHDNDHAYAVDEIIGSKNTFELIEAIKFRYPNRKIIVYPDASGNAGDTGAKQSDLATLNKAGFVVKAFMKNPSIRDRVNSVNALFLNGKGQRVYLVNINKCKVLTSCLEKQTYGDDGKPTKDGKVDGPLDAMGYFIYFNWPIQGKPNIRTF